MLCSEVICDGTVGQKKFFLIGADRIIVICCFPIYSLLSPFVLAFHRSPCQSQPRRSQCRLESFDPLQLRWLTEWEGSWNKELVKAKIKGNHNGFGKFIFSEKKKIYLRRASAKCSLLNIALWNEESWFWPKNVAETFHFNLLQSVFNYTLNFSVLL